MAEASRRSLVQWLLGGGFAASIGSFLYPVIRFMNPPEVAEATVNEATVAEVGEFALNSGKIVRFGSKPVLLIRSSATEWRRFSGICTHLDCTIQYRDTDRLVWCACHNGLYDLNGTVLLGPPARPLEEYDVHIRGEEVIVSRRA